MSSFERNRDKMTAMTFAIDQAINAPRKDYTTKEAQELLQRHGVLTKKNTVSKAYSEIIVKVEKRADEAK